MFSVPTISDLKPPRTPLHSKKTKRCSECRHILIKPEQKAQSVRYKIKLLAASYLPTIEIARRLPTDPRLGGGTGRRPGSSRLSVLPVAATPVVEGEGLRRGGSVSPTRVFFALSDGGRSEEERRKGKRRGRGRVDISRADFLFPLLCVVCSTPTA